MDTITNFVNDVSEFEINFPLWVKSGIILVIILFLGICGYFLRESFNIAYLRNGYTWFILIAVINLITIFTIFTFYGKKSGTYVGRQGARGKRGKRGKVGASQTCSYDCKSNLYIQTVRKNNITCHIDFKYDQFKYTIDSYMSFQKYILEGIEINYSGLINIILLGNPIPLSSSFGSDAVARFTILLNSNNIAVCLIKSINENTSITLIDEESGNKMKTTYGTFRTVSPKLGYLSIGDSAYNGIQKYTLNSFVISGDIMYPNGFNKLVSFEAYNNNTNETSIFTIWRPQPQTVNDIAFDGSREPHEYLPLGDICNSESNPPNINNIAMIKDTCLEPVSSKELKMVFIHAGNLGFNDAQNTEKYIQSDSYLVSNKVANDIEIFSVWRTPINTFITNYNSGNDLINNTVIYNILNNLDDALNDYGNISVEYKKWVISRLSSFELSSVLIAMIYVRHFQLEATKDLMYYINRYQSNVLEFRGHDIPRMSLADMMKLISSTNNSYNNFNKELIKQASIQLNSGTPNISSDDMRTLVSSSKASYKKYNPNAIRDVKVSTTGNSVIKYDSKKEKHLPQLILKTYNNVQTLLDTIPIKISNSNNLYDVITNIIPNGLEARIAIDSNGITQGGILLNEIQETIIRLCKVLMPPTYQGYNIKDDCLGTVSIDHEKKKKIDELITERDKFDKYLTTIIGNAEYYEMVENNLSSSVSTAEKNIVNTNYDLYGSQLQTVINCENNIFNKIGQLCGHIPNYMEKIKNMEMEEFTISRVKGLIAIYKEGNVILGDIVQKTQSVAAVR